MKGVANIKLIHKSRSAAVQFTLKSSTTSLLKKGWRDPLMQVFTDFNISKENLVLSQLIMFVEQLMFVKQLMFVELS